MALPKWKARVDSWKVKMKEHDDNMLSYLVVLRMMPLPPHNIGEYVELPRNRGIHSDFSSISHLLFPSPVNILSPHLGITIPIFWLSTFMGIFAVSVIHVTIGEKLDDMSSASDFNLISFRNFLLLAFVCVAVMIPVIVRRFNKVEPLEEDVNGGGRVRLDGEENRLNASGGLVGRSRGDTSDDDEEDEDRPRIRIHGTQNLDDDFSENESERGTSAWRNEAEIEARGNSNSGAWSDEESSRGFSDRREHGPRPGSKAARILGGNDNVERSGPSTKIIGSARDLWGWATGSSSNDSRNNQSRNGRVRI